MNDQFPFSVDQVIHALSEAGGIYFAAAAKLGCEREVVERYAETYVDVQEALAKIAVNNDDVAEVAFLKAVAAGESWAVQRQLQKAAARRTGEARARGERDARGRFTDPGHGPPKGPGWGERIAQLMIPADATPAEEAAFRKERARRMEAIIEDAALTADHPTTRVMAAAKLQEIDAPKVVRNINLNLGLEDVAQLADRDLDAELARLERAAVSASEGEAPAPLPPALPDLRH